MVHTIWIRTFSRLLLNTFICECLENSVVCGGTLSGHSGMIQSPGWPNEYPNNEYCQWTFYCDESENVAIQFETFDLEKDSSCK